MGIRKKNYNLSGLEKQYGVLTLGRFLSAWRLSEKQSQVQFAKQIGISPANLCDIERGRKGVSIYKAIEIAKLIGYSPTILVELALQELVNSAGLNYAVKLKKRVG